MVMGAAGVEEDGRNGGEDAHQSERSWLEGIMLA